MTQYVTSNRKEAFMSSNERIIEILFKLVTNETINISELSSLYCVNTRTIQRDISTIKNLANSFHFTFNYDELGKTYSLSKPEQLIFEDTLAISKILLASRALPADEMKKILTNLILLNNEHDVSSIKRSIKNELTFYHPLTHNQQLLQLIKEMDKYILEKKLLDVKYKKNTDSIIHRTVLPVSIFFSEYYFYAICYEPKKDRYINLRIDRFINIEPTNQKMSIPYKERLEEKELREKMLFMYSGQKTTFTFRFYGVIEAALDKFPNSKVTKIYDDSSVLIEATAYDTGTIMWLLSQGSNAKVLSPSSLVDKMIGEIKKMNNMYE